MKRYWLFHYDDYYPDGGMEDFVCSYDELSVALEKGIELRRQRSTSGRYQSEAHVVDSITGEKWEVLSPELISVAQ